MGYEPQNKILSLIYPEKGHFSKDVVAYKSACMKYKLLQFGVLQYKSIEMQPAEKGNISALSKL